MKTQHEKNGVENWVKMSRVKTMNQMFLSALLAALLLPVSTSRCQSLLETFGSGANQFTIEFVIIGNPGNSAISNTLPTQYYTGSVPYTYNMGKYEISRGMIEKAINLGLTGVSLGDMTNYGGNSANRPATGINWYEAAKFVNFLNTSSGSAPAYKFDSSGNFQVWTAGESGYQSGNIFRNSLARYFIPSTDEWFKAAYGAPDGSWFTYPTGSNTKPLAVSGGKNANTAIFAQPEISGPADVGNAGGESAFGTIAQGGNVWEWHETAEDGNNNLIEEQASISEEYKQVWGGSWKDDGTLYSGIDSFFLSTNPGRSDGGGIPSQENQYTGFRIAMVPEPSALSLLAVGLGVLFRRSRKRD